MNMTKENKKLKAKRDHEFMSDDGLYIIKKGDDISHIPERYHDNLRTEKVI